MPRLYHRPPKYCHHKATQQATVSLNGKRIYLGPYGSPKSHREYQRILELWHTQRDTPPPKKDNSISEKRLASVTAATLREKRIAGSPLTVNELALVFRRHAQEYYRKNGTVTREASLFDDVIRILRKYHATSFLDDFGPVSLEALREKMIGDLGWSRKHINKQVGRLIRMFKWASSKELVNPKIPLSLASLSGLKKGRCEAKESPGVGCVDDSVVTATISKLPKIVGDMVKLQRLTGARPSEVCNLRPCDMDRTGDVWIYTPAEHKTEHHEKGRTIVIGPKAQRLLKPYLLGRLADSYCFSPAESEQKRREAATKARTTPASCGNRPGTNRCAAPKRKANDRYTTDSYRRAIHRACEANDITKWSPNRLRHTSATEIRRRFGLEAAQVVCGHESAEVTQVYAERDLELAKKVARALG